MNLAQSRQKKQHDQQSQTREVELGDVMSVRNYSQGSKWVPGTIIQEPGPPSARVELLEDGMVVWRHHDQSISRTTKPFRPSPTAQGQAIAKRKVLFRRLQYPMKIAQK